MVFKVLLVLQELLALRVQLVLQGIQVFKVLLVLQVIGNTGPTGSQGPTGTDGVQGPTGSQGISGNFGGNTFHFRFDTETSSTNLDSGFLRPNNTSQNSATIIYINTTDNDSNDFHQH